MSIGIVVGLRAEARVARPLGCRVAIGGGTAEGAALAAERLATEGVRGLVSFGLAGGLDPALRPGALLVPRAVLTQAGRFAADAGLAGILGGFTADAMVGDGLVLADAAAKRALHLRTGAVAVDLESGAVARAAARHGLPFAVLRAVCDPAERNLPPAVLMALDGGGAIGLGRVAGSVLRRPGQIGGLLALARDAAAARRALAACIARIGRWPEEGSGGTKRP